MWSRSVSHTVNINNPDQSKIGYTEIKAFDPNKHHAAFVRVEMRLLDLETNNSIVRALCVIDALQESDAKSGKNLILIENARVLPEPCNEQRYNKSIQELLRFVVNTHDRSTLKCVFAAIEKASKVGLPLEEINQGIDEIFGNRVVNNSESSFKLGITVFKPVQEGNVGAFASQCDEAQITNNNGLK